VASIFPAGKPERPVVEMVVAGFGGCGCNTVSNLYGKSSARLIAVDTDASNLTVTKADKTLQVGEALTKGRGTGGDIGLGRKVAESDVDNILDVLGAPDLLIAAAGLGGGVGSGTMPYVLAAFREKYPDKLIGAVVTVPFKYEGIERLKNTQIAIRELLDAADFVIVNLNDLLLKRYGVLPVQDAMKIMDSILANGIFGLVDMLDPTNSVIRTDFSDFTAVVRRSGVNLLGYGVQANARKATERAIAQSLLDADLSTARGALVFVKAPLGANLQEASEAPRILNELYGVSKVTWGLKVAPDVKRTHVMVVASGVTSKTINETLSEVGGE